MTAVHYFPRYSQPENFVTNNTLLLLHRLHEFSRFRFEQLLTALVPESADAAVEFSLGLQIKQQIATKRSVVDGFLYQSGFKIVIETKLYGGAFYEDQLTRHLEAFGLGVEAGYLFLLSPDSIPSPEVAWPDLCAKAKAQNVLVISITFQELIRTAQRCLREFDEEMNILLADYEAFCSEQSLLPADEWTIFVPPCGRSHPINVEDRLYFCPANWSRRKARYLGVYYWKAVRQIGVVSKVVECDIVDGKVVGESTALTGDEKERILHAARSALEIEGWDLTSGHQFFLCDEMVETEFSKSTSGGIQGHRYIDLREHFRTTIPDDLKVVAEQLRASTWK